MEVDWEIVERPGVTRKERFSEDDPIEELPGPVLADGCDRICVECEARLRMKVLPLFSLANQLWIGKVPWQLRDLSFVEKS